MVSYTTKYIKVMLRKLQTHRLRQQLSLMHLRRRSQQHPYRSRRSQLQLRQQSQQLQSLQRPQQLKLLRVPGRVIRRECHINLSTGQNGQVVRGGPVGQGEELHTSRDQEDRWVGSNVLDKFCGSSSIGSYEQRAVLVSKSPSTRTKIARSHIPCVLFPVRWHSDDFGTRDACPGSYFVSSYLAFAFGEVGTAYRPFWNSNKQAKLDPQIRLPHR